MTRAEAREQMRLAVLAVEAAQTDFIEANAALARATEELDRAHTKLLTGLWLWDTDEWTRSA